MSESWTVARLLAWMTQDFAALGVGSPRLDAELLLCHVLQCDRVRLYMEMPRPLAKEELDAARSLVQRRRKREPVAYILGQKEFYRYMFEVSPSVLVPRPDTELLVDRALDVLSPKTFATDPVPSQLSDESGEPLPAEVSVPSASIVETTVQQGKRVLDLCTGTGAVAITLAAELETLLVDATDISAPALEVAKRNAQRNGVDARMSFFLGDLFAAVPSDRRYAVITANPPYVTDAEYAQLAPEITQHEPKIALTSGADGLDVLRRICAQAADRLEPGGALLLEVGHQQASAVRALLESAQRFASISVHRDYGGVERVVQAQLS